MQKQSRVFFQISGAGHEALGLGPGPPPAARLRLVLPLLPRPGAVPRPRASRRPRSCCRRSGSADDPASGGRQMPSHWGKRDAQHRHPVEPDRQPVHPGGRVRRGGAATSCGGPQLPGCAAHGDELTYVCLGEGACSEGEFWESLNTACNLHLPVLYVVADNGFAISVPATDQHPAPVAELVARLPRPRGAPARRHRLLRGARERRASIIEHVRAGVGPALHPRRRGAARTRTRRPTPRASTARPTSWPTRRPAIPIDRMRARAGRGRRADRRRGGRASGPRPRRSWPRPAAEALAAAPARSGPRHRARLRALPVAADAGRAADGRAASRCRWARRSGARCTSDGGRRAHPGVRRGRGRRPRGGAGQRRGQGRRVRHHARAAARRSARPAASTRRCRRPTSSAGPSARASAGLRPAPEIQFFDYIWPAMTQIKSEAATIRWRSNGAFTCPMVMRVPIGGYLTGGAIWHSQCGESIFAHVPGLLIAFPSRAARRRRAAALRVPLRGPGAVPRAQAPAAPAVHRRPVPAGPTT